MPENKNYWLLYDGTCRFCLGMVKRWRGTLENRGFGFAALQEEWVRERLDLPEEELLREMRVLAPCGKVLGAADAFVFLWGKIWWCWPLWILAHIPGARWLINR
ncbi:MAG: DCC1-like thiol-disulfide oxidoreductase family protein, partial [Planctomycetota bacterium]|nr:DCC1-like thiol-disulfide oxidoreductase family protein [Planctomycetota bacterium]